jgi:hypothetical protein
METILAILLFTSGVVTGLIVAVFLPASVGDWRRARRIAQEDRADVLAQAVAKAVQDILDRPALNSASPTEGSKLLH